MRIDLDALASLLYCPACNQRTMAAGTLARDLLGNLAPVSSGNIALWCTSCSVSPLDGGDCMIGTPHEAYEKLSGRPVSSIPPVVHLCFDDDLETFRSDLAAIESAGVLELPRQAAEPVALGQRLGRSATPIRWPNLGLRAEIAELGQAPFEHLLEVIRRMRRP